MRYKTYFNWSSGKDSALALYDLLEGGNYDVQQLITTVNTHYNRVSMHGLRRELLVAQTKSIGIEASIIELPEMPSMDIYEQKMFETIGKLKLDGYTHAAFGDIFLEDLRNYRDQQLKKLDVRSVYPLWKKDTKYLIERFLDLGFKTVIVCADAKYFDKSFVGIEIDNYFIKNLPSNVDPCGENGEFHTFCFDGPIFNKPIPLTIGETIYREYDAPKTDTNSTATKTGFWFCDLIKGTV